MSPVADTLIGGVKASVPQPMIDYSRYVRRYSSGQECGSSYCKDLGCREHFHCLDCSGRVFVKKEEMIRHFKWHKKRDESLQHGFMRYSQTDDCSERHPSRVCPHNRKQTHYHCIHENCDKVYISTSDVQMHANYHRKDSAILQEGFQRFRATESCATEHCPFTGQRTTHFHCRRIGCRFTFKNKADMGEKRENFIPRREKGIVLFTSQFQQKKCIMTKIVILPVESNFKIKASLILTKPFKTSVQSKHGISDIFVSR